MNEPLLAVLSALVAALIWMVKTTTSRSDRMIEQRDKDVARLITTLEASVASSQAYERNSSAAFEHMVTRLDAGVAVQEGVLSELQSMNERLATDS